MFLSGDRKQGLALVKDILKDPSRNDLVDKRAKKLLSLMQEKK
jgi:hypothetical protein